VAWKDIGYYCAVEVHEHWLEVKVYQFYLWREYDEPEWDGESPLVPGEAPSGHAFDREDAKSTPCPVKRVSEAELFLSGSVKWDGCSNLRFDHQDNVMLHFCGRKEATSIGVLLGRLYDLAAAMVPAFDESLAE
jgi:hypothetical protein